MSEESMSGLGGDKPRWAPTRNVVSDFAMNCPPAWAGEHSDTYAYVLAGALATLMVPPGQEIPTERIAEIIERVNQAGPGPRPRFIATSSREAE